MQIFILAFVFLRALVVADTGAREAVCKKLHRNIRAPLWGLFASATMLRLARQIQLVCEMAEYSESLSGNFLISLIYVHKGFVKSFDTSEYRSIRYLPADVLQYPAGRSLVADLDELWLKSQQASVRVIKDARDFTEFSGRNKVIKRMLENVDIEIARESLSQFVASRELLTEAALSLRSPETRWVLKEYRSKAAALIEIITPHEVADINGRCETVQRLLATNSLESVKMASKILFATITRAAGLRQDAPGVQELTDRLMILRDSLYESAHLIINQLISGCADIVKNEAEVLSEGNTKNIVENMERVEITVNAVNLFKERRHQNPATVEKKLSEIHEKLKAKVAALRRAAGDAMPKKLRALKSKLDDVLDIIYDSPEKAHTVDVPLSEIQVQLDVILEEDDAPLFKTTIDGVSILLKEARERRVQIETLAPRISVQVKKSEDLIGKISNMRIEDLANDIKLELDLRIQENSAVLREFPTGHLIELQNRLLGIRENKQRRRQENDPQRNEDTPVAGFNRFDGTRHGSRPSTTGPSTGFDFRMIIILMIIITILLAGLYCYITS